MGESNHRRIARARLGASAALAVWALGTVAAPARAAPEEDPMLSGAATFFGPTDPTSLAIVINPAAMALASRGQHVLALGSLRLSHLSIDRDLVTADGSVLSGPAVSSATPSPSGMLAFDFAIADNWRFGVSLQTSLALRFPQDEQALRYYTLGGSIYQYTGSASTSVAATDRILFGFGIQLGYSAVHLRFARDTALDGGTPGIESDCGGTPCGIENPLADQLYNVHTRTGSAGDLGKLFAARNIGIVGGAMVRVTKHWWVAASVVLPPGSVAGPLTLSGEARVTGPARLGQRAVSGDAELNFDAPMAVFAAVRGPLSSALDLVAHLRWQNLSVHQIDDLRFFGGDLEGAGVPAWLPHFRGYSDELTAVVGVETPEERRVRYGGRLILDSGAVGAAEMNPITPSPASIGLNGGVELRLGDHLVLTGIYGLTAFEPIDSDDSAFDPLDRIRCVDQDFDLNACKAAREGRALPTAEGSYRHFDHSFLLSLRYDTL